MLNYSLDQWNMPLNIHKVHECHHTNVGKQLICNQKPDNVTVVPILILSTYSMETGNILYQHFTAFSVC